MKRGALILSVGGALGYVVTASRIMLVANLIVIIGAAVEWARRESP